MAKKDKEKDVDVPITKETDNVKLSKLLIEELNKDQAKTGKMAWNLATDLDNPTDVKEWISTDSTLLDYAISNRRDGGIPVGKISEISGEEASGKSLLCAHLCKNVQKKGGIVAYLDTENAMHPEFASQLGVDLSKMIYVQPGTIEEVGETIEKIILMVRQKAKDKLVLIVWDSIAGTPPQAEIEGTFDPNERMGVTAKAMSKMMRKLTQTVGTERIALVFTNQLRYSFAKYGDPFITPGGKAVPFFASVRIRLQRRGAEKEGADKETGDLGKGDVVGVNTTAKVVKNRLGPPHRKCNFFISFAHGIEDIPSWFEKLHETGFIEKANGWCYFTGLPSGKIEDQGVNKGKDRGMKFREKEFVEFVETEVAYSPAQIERLHNGEREKDVGDTAGVLVFDWVKDQIEKAMIVKYGLVPHDAEIDPESQMDVEQVVADLIDPQ
jgi:recombination protein RecA